MRFTTVFVFAIVYLAQAALSQVIGLGNALNRYNFGNNNNCNSNSANIVNGLSGDNIGYGNINVEGELPVTGQTKIIGNLPVIGFVTFEGHLPAGGLVSLADGCNGNFN